MSGGLWMHGSLHLPMSKRVAIKSFTNKGDRYDNCSSWQLGSFAVCLPEGSGNVPKKNQQSVTTKGRQKAPLFLYNL